MKTKKTKLKKTKINQQPKQQFKIKKMKKSVYLIGILFLAIGFVSCSKESKTNDVVIPTKKQDVYGDPIATQSICCNHVFQACLTSTNKPGEVCVSGQGGCRKMKECTAYTYSGTSLDDGSMATFVPTLGQIETMASENAANAVTNAEIYTTDQTEYENSVRANLLDFYY